MFGAALEETSDRNRERIFVACGLIGRDFVWNGIEDKWWSRLKQDGVAYYKTSSCKGLDGPFCKFKSAPDGRAKANRLRDDLESFLTSSHLIGFAIGCPMDDYKEVLREIPQARMFYEDDPTVMAFYHLMYQINRTIRRKAKGCSVAFIYDQSSSSRKLMHAFDALKVVHPLSSRSMATFAPLDDRDHAPLQAADMLSNVCREEIFEPWLNEGRPRFVPVPQRWRGNLDFMGKFDKDYMLYTIRKNLANPRFIGGLLPLRQMGTSERRRRARMERNAKENDQASKGNKA
jgi:hypothetical protein